MNRDNDRARNATVGKRCRGQENKIIEREKETRDRAKERTRDLCHKERKEPKYRQIGRQNIRRNDNTEDRKA